MHIGDFRAQMRRTLANITGLLASEGCTWHDIVRTSCYLRDIERDYEAFNEERTAFFKEQGLDPLPASTGIQAILCRPELLIEIEAIAMFRTDKAKAEQGVPDEARRECCWPRRACALWPACCILRARVRAEARLRLCGRTRTFASAERIRRVRRRIALSLPMRASRRI